MNDEHWMHLALDEARKGIGKTAPNPPVGAVLVKNGEVIGRGWHQRAGMPHAEREAIADAQRNHGADAARGATAYVTLEPCSTQGRTPACTGGLIDADITRVVYACVDPNPAHAGRADALLAAAGIEVLAGVCANEVRKILRPFEKVAKTGLPWVIWKSAMSLDGRLTRPPGEGQWLTGEAARHDVQKLRPRVDAIHTGCETVRRDKTALTIRVPEFLEGRTQPWRVVFTDKPESLPQDAPLFADPWRERTLLRTGADLESTLRALVSEHGILCAMVEAGGRFSAALFEAGLIDEVIVYTAPLLCGGHVPALAGKGLPQAIKLEETSFERFGDDVRMGGIIVR